MSTKYKAGFTIIEVVLVLAIAGLIFLMVFVALPTLQKSQKDTQRRNDIARVGTALLNYYANNKKLPNKNEQNITQTFIDNYLGGSDFKDPNGEPYKLHIDIIQSSASYGTPVNNYINGNNDSYKIAIYENAKCGSGSDVGKAVYNAGASNYAVMYDLEGSGTYCIDNS